MVPRAIQNAVWHYYRQGQRKQQGRSPEHVEACNQAVKAVARVEGKPLEEGKPVAQDRKGHDAIRPL